MSAHRSTASQPDRALYHHHSQPLSPRTDAAASTSARMQIGNILNLSPVRREASPSPVAEPTSTSAAETRCSQCRKDRRKVCLRSPRLLHLCPRRSGSETDVVISVRAEQQQWHLGLQALRGFPFHVLYGWGGGC